MKKLILNYRSTSEYWQLSFETQLNVLDAFLSGLTVKYCENKMKSGDPKSIQEAVQFSKKVNEGQSFLSKIRGLLMQSKHENNQLFIENQELKKRIIEFEQSENATDSLKRSEIEEKFKREISDKYQIQIQELEQEKEELIKALAKSRNN